MIDRDQVLREVTELVASKPDGYKYEDALADAGLDPALADRICFYDSTTAASVARAHGEDTSEVADVPLCLVGQWAHRFHPDIYAALCGRGAGVRPVLGPLEVVDDPALDLLDDLQGQQDCGVPWGEALGQYAWEDN